MLLHSLNPALTHTINHSWAYTFIAPLLTTDVVQDLSGLWAVWCRMSFSGWNLKNKFILTDM